MSEQGFVLFETVIGLCAIAWQGDALIGTQLPETTAEKSRSRLLRRIPGCREAEPPEWAAALVNMIIAHIAGNRVDYRDVPLDRRRAGAWENAVYDVASAIPSGETRTYGQLARSLGRPDAAQAVGQALGRNPWPIIVPCHRILAADGGTGGFSAPGGVATKIRLLEIEGALAPATLPLFAQSQG